MPVAGALVLVSGCFVVIDLPEGSDTAPDAGVGGIGGSGASAASGGSGASGGSAGSLGGSAGGGGTAGAGNSGGVAGGGGSAGTTCINPPCDCDNDGHDAEGGSCGGDDCDDTDPEVFTGQTAWFTKPNKQRTFEYDCKNGPEKRYGIVSCGLGDILNCDKKAAGYYDGSAGCGEQVAFGKCQWDGSAGLAGMCVESKLSDGPVECH
jgi:hypothetical protein